MTPADHQLLMAAADAAGIPYNPTVKLNTGLFCANENNQEDSYVWNPLEDTDQALQLARQLRINIRFSVFHVLANSKNDKYEACELIAGGNKATRRVIVRVAAMLSPSQ